MSGKMKIKGNMAAAMKFTPDLLPPMPKLWNISWTINIYDIHILNSYIDHILNLYIFFIYWVKINFYFL